MGDNLGDLTPTDAPTHTVHLDAFHIGKYEVTKAEWDEVRAWGLVNGYTDIATGSGKASNHPIQSISWWDAIKWCNARSQMEGLTPVYVVKNSIEVMKTGTTVPVVYWNANGYRLPTEAEWERAARGNLTNKRFPWGDTISHQQANYTSNESYGHSFYDLSWMADSYHPSFATGAFPFTSPVGSFAANSYGLYDMAGNVSEWCWDWYGNYATGDPTEYGEYPNIDVVINPRGAQGCPVSLT